MNIRPNKWLMAALLAAPILVQAAAVELVSGKDVNATGWFEITASADGALTAQAELKAFQPRLEIVTTAPRDPNLPFTHIKGFGAPVPVGTGLAPAEKGMTVKSGDKVRFRITIPVAKDAPAGIVRGKITFKAGGKDTTEELALRVMDFTLPPAKSRYLKREWIARTDGQVAATWTRETEDTYRKDSAKVTDVVTSWKLGNELLSAERWHAFGVGYYALLDIPRTVNPDAYRRAAGVAAWQAGYDGVALPPPGNEPWEAVVVAGVEDAAIDVRYISYLKELSDRFADKKLQTNNKMVLEGRLGQFWVDRIRINRDDLDIVRLEAIARIVRLNGFIAKGGVK